MSSGNRKCAFRISAVSWCYDICMYMHICTYIHIYILLSRSFAVHVSKQASEARRSQESARVHSASSVICNTLKKVQRITHEPAGAQCYRTTRRRRRPQRHSYMRGRSAINTHTTTWRGHTLSRTTQWYRQQHGAWGIESGPIAVWAYGHTETAWCIAADIIPPPYLHCIPCQAISTIFRWARCNISASGGRARGPAAGVYYIRLSGKRVQKLHAYSESSQMRERHGETRNGDYRTVRSSVVRMPSLPPECLLVHGPWNVPIPTLGFIPCRPKRYQRPLVITRRLSNLSEKSVLFLFPSYPFGFSSISLFRSPCTRVMPSSETILTLSFQFYPSRQYSLLCCVTLGEIGEWDFWLRVSWYSDIPSKLYSLISLLYHIFNVKCDYSYS